MIITVIGGDNRQRELARLLNKNYDTIYLSGNEEIKTAKSIVKISDVIILPLPVTRDNQTINTTSFLISDIFGSTDNNTVIFAGMCDKIDCKSTLVDYNKDEEFTEKNALYTAESAVALAIFNTPFSLSDANVLILGNGRIGKALGNLLTPFCKNITVSARKQKDFDYIISKGFSNINSNEITDLSYYDVIINTIPFKVISENALSTVCANSIIIDLASKNSGLFIDSPNYIDAKSLPSKYCRKSSAKALYDSVIKHL
ncbi:MAG: dipicolinate synthase subunit DpsA [Acutalibacteraceae bacterium]|nr:dipicolinate synthase subunit DpsA [Acutalibacteraceae bacterium]